MRSDGEKPREAEVGGDPAPAKEEGAEEVGGAVAAEDRELAPAALSRRGAMPRERRRLSRSSCCLLIAKPWPSCVTALTQGTAACGGDHDVRTSDSTTSREEVERAEVGSSALKAEGGVAGDAPSLKSETLRIHHGSLDDEEEGQAAIVPSQKEDD